MEPIIDDEEFVATARIYHRYRLAGFHRPGGDTNLSAVQAPQPTQPSLPFPYNSSEEEERVIDQLVTPINDVIDRLRQDRLRTIVIQEASSFESTLTRRDRTRYRGFEEYIARHESLSKLTVRLFRADIPHPKQVQQFHVYRLEEPEPDVFLFGAQGTVVEAFLRRILSGNPHLTITHPRLDLKALSEVGEAQIRGASFRITGKPNLTTAMVFGPDVNEDDSWETYSRIGQLTYVHLQMEVESQAIRMMVTGHGSILPYGVDDIYEELILCKEVYEKLLRRFELGHAELRRTRRRV